jgi:Skp family chaperone for outer membrane proteins
MKSAERLVIYTGLALCLVMGMANSVLTPSAIATPAAGSADAPKIASVDVLSIVERVIASEPYSKPREDNQKAQLERLKPLNDELTKMSEELKGMKEDAASFRPLLKVLEDKNSAFMNVRNEAANQVEAFNTQQVAEAYAKVSEAAAAMAQSRGYSHLFASKAGATKINSVNIPGAVQEMLARPLLRGVAADDLTDALVKEMNLESVVVPAAATPVVAPGQTPAAPGGAK